MATNSILKATIMLTTVDNMTKGVRGAITRSQAALQRFDGAATTALIAGGAITAGLGMAISAAEESEVATNRLNQVFKSMGETTDAAAKASAAYASTLAMQIGQEDEAIMAAQAKLATFSAVSNETARMSGVFDRATKAAFDLSAAGFGDAAGTSVQLGKALQDPIKGITALRKSGVSFTAAEQDKIKALTASGRLFEAQDIILKAVETQVGGVAAATATGSAKMRIAFGEIAETAGAALLPVVSELMAAITPMLMAFRSWVEANPNLVKGIAAVGVALLTFGGVIKIATGAMRIFAAVCAINPFIVIIAAVIAVTVLIYNNWGAITAFFGRTFERIKGFLSGLGAYWVSIFTGIMDYVYSIPSKMYDAGVNLISSLWEGMKSMAWAPIQAISDITSGIRDYLPFSPAKEGALRDIHRIKLVETIAQSITPGPIMRAVGGVTQAVANYGGTNTPSLAGVTTGSGTTTINFSPTINVTGGTATGQNPDIMTQLKSFLPMLQRELAAKQERDNRKKY